MMVPCDGLKYLVCISCFILVKIVSSLLHMSRPVSLSLLLPHVFPRVSLPFTCLSSLRCPFVPTFSLSSLWFWTFVFCLNPFWMCCHVVDWPLPASITFLFNKPLHITYGCHSDPVANKGFIYKLRGKRPAWVCAHKCANQHLEPWLFNLFYLLCLVLNSMMLVWLILKFTLCTETICLNFDIQTHSSHSSVQSIKIFKHKPGELHLIRHKHISIITVSTQVEHVNTHQHCSRHFSTFLNHWQYQPLSFTS